MWFQKNKAKSKILRAVAVIIAFIITVGLIALFLWGWFLTFEKDDLRGIIPMAVAVVFSLAQIIAGLLLRDDEE